MFTIGVRLSPRELVDAGWMVGAVGLAQVAFLVLAGAGFSGVMGLGAKEAFVFGGAAAISSTMIALRQLEDAGEIESPAGKTAVGSRWYRTSLPCPMIVVIPALASGDDPLPSIGLAALRGVALVAGVWFIGRFVAPRVLWTTARWRSRELFLLSVLVLALGTASVSSRRRPVTRFWSVPRRAADLGVRAGAQDADRGLPATGDIRRRLLRRRGHAC